MVTKAISPRRSQSFERSTRAPGTRRSIRRAKIALALTSVVLCSQSLAVDSFSRACRFDQIPPGLQAIAVTFFSLLGAPAWVRDLPNHPEKQKYWVLESITTDYLSSRFYLGARHTIYQWHQGNYSGWLQKVKRDSGLARDLLDRSVLTDDKFKIFTKNRGILFSARAGSPEIVERTDKIAGANPWSNRWRVVGQHYYYDPDRKAEVLAGQTVAEDCNLAAGWPRP